ncbi:Thymus-specific serine protease [Aphanomyces cochlioides]|nr:Thymus-specific serine protease [Aphanomyces cochlioides]
MDALSVRAFVSKHRMALAVTPKSFLELTRCSFGPWCLSHSWLPLQMAAIKDSSSNSSVSKTTCMIDQEGWSRQWKYQTCREFGFAQATATVDANVAATNQRYGGFKINVENVVFPSSSYDPWSALALSNSTGVVNPKSQVVYIQGGSHCRDLYARKTSDPAPIQWAHDQVQAAVKRFLSKKKC